MYSILLVSDYTFLHVSDDTENVLVGMGCMVTTEHIGYFYDIFRKAREVHNFSFINPGQMFMYDGDFLHIVNEQGLESYTTRLLPTCLKGLNKPLTFTERYVHQCPHASLHSYVRKTSACTYICTYSQVYIRTYVYKYICSTFGRLEFTCLPEDLYLPVSP